MRVWRGGASVHVSDLCNEDHRVGGTDLLALKECGFSSWSIKDNPMDLTGL